MILLAQFMIWFGLSVMLLSLAAQEINHAPWFYGVSKALRSVFPVYLPHEPDQFVQIISELDETDR